MTDSELADLLKNLESDRVERKESIADGARIRQAICAFANDLPNHNQPGVVFVGVRDDATCAHLSITDQLLQTLAGMRSDGNILPMPSMTVQKRTVGGCTLAVIEVQPADAPPVRHNGSTWGRVGPRRAIASAEEERRLNEKRRFKDLPVDVRPLPSAALDALDELLFRRVYLPAAVSPEVLHQNQRALEDQLLAARFAHPGPPVCASVLGVLTVGRNPTEWVPGAYVQFLRVDGMGLTDPVQSAREIRGPLPDLLTELDELLKVNIQASVSFTSGPVEVRSADYPLVALQQIVRNAVLHRSYENTHAPVRLYWFKDRVEVMNPGGPYGQVTRANFGEPGACDYRNPNLAAVMKELGYVQRFGVGIALARQEMAKNGNPPPEFLVEDSHVAVILRRRP
ncbi:MAG: putative DNA binding domain-containing protein [Planctomycetes bacterium]|nr:putative DNA binding domain-containing protein [Planctomycetota bacterium]